MQCLTSAKDNTVELTLCCALCDSGFQESSHRRHAGAGANKDNRCPLVGQFQRWGKDFVWNPCTCEFVSRVPPEPRKTHLQAWC